MNGPHTHEHDNHDHEHEHEHEHSGSHEHSHPHKDDHEHGHNHPHGGVKGFLYDLFVPHTHDAADSVDDALEASNAGVTAVKVSMFILLGTTVLQLIFVVFTGSVALLADTIHNFADALTAVPLWIAFVLGRDLDGDQLTVADLFRAIDYAVPAIEIVGSRVADWDIRITDTIADNASSGLYVLGSRPVRLTDFDMRACGMVMEKAGEPVSVGAGAACLGSPLNATLWLAQVMAEAGRPMRAGDTVLSGALGPMVAVAPGDVFDVRIEGLGSVRAAFSKE